MTSTGGGSRATARPVAAARSDRGAPLAAAPFGRMSSKLLPDRQGSGGWDPLGDRPPIAAPSESPPCRSLPVVVEASRPRGIVRATRGPFRDRGVWIRANDCGMTGWFERSADPGDVIRPAIRPHRVDVVDDRCGVEHPKRPDRGRRWRGSPRRDGLPGEDPRPLVRALGPPSPRGFTPRASRSDPRPGWDLTNCTGVHYGARVPGPTGLSVRKECEPC